MKSWLKILIGLGAGILVGAIMGPKAQIFQVFGKAFIYLLTMLVLLIIFSSLIVGICHIHDPKKLGRIGIKTLSFYVLTTILAASLGVFLVNAFAPGVGLELSVKAEPIGSANWNLADFFLSLIPSNPFASFANGNVLQVIIFAIFLAIAIIYSKEKAQPLLKLMESVAHTMHTLTHFVMTLAPYGVFALMAATIGTIGWKIIVPLAKFLFIIYGACFFQLFVVFTLCLKYLGKVRVVPFFKGMKDAILLAFTTSSSAATLPVSLECTQKHLGISADISGFVLSLGSTINMNGTAIGQAVSAIFIAQAYGIEVTVIQMVLLVFISLVAAIGTAGISGSGLIMLSLVLQVMGLPLEGIALVAGVDRLRDMIASVVNVLGDAVAALIVAKGEKEIDVSTYNRATWLESDI
ncbi:MAG: dicarboxylate/amino acid:cation symporter [Chlamydiae bacterium CG10_big_fil_rev_8_21_14_0_10_35_9]|nr:MAG: dicarboxylate/amino acid:cation symporter [Chlamydiae bacterium CG10_big_fil_rev_8_21_14_0_10_35_9]